MFGRNVQRMRHTLLNTHTNTFARISIGWTYGQYALIIHWGQRWKKMRAIANSDGDDDDRDSVSMR